MNSFKSKLVLRESWNSSNLKIQWPAHVERRGKSVFACSVALLLTGVCGFGQEVFVPANPPSGTEPRPGASQESRPTRMEAADAPGRGEGGAESEAPVMNPRPQVPFTWGPVTLRPHASYQFLYGSGIHFQPGQDDETIVQTISPGLRVDIGRRWVLDYTPAFSFYSSDEFEDTVDHTASLSGRVAYHDWSFGLSQTASLTTEPRAETGLQTDQESYFTVLGASRQLSSTLALELGVFQQIRFLSGFAGALQESRSWSTLDWLNYQAGPFGYAVGAGFGYVDVSTGNDMMFEQLQGRMTFRLTDKIDFVVNGGAEVRQILDSDEDDLVNPIFGASIQYRPFQFTTLALNASRTINSSYFANQITEATEVRLDLRQRLLGQFMLGLSGGFRNTEYESTLSTVSVDRTDDNMFFRATITKTILKRGTVSVFYAIGDHDSSQEDFSYTSNQVGFSLAYSY